ncbi:Splicing factor-like protein [Trema orientale]|uniref:Splicing factor-like protein n=1 Tax=Trema orientale TaxID=63057 RepID=A0A2P5BZG8_TREOI|nr:Splicing factor-like protein [Trema orientale]
MASTEKPKKRKRIPTSERRYRKKLKAQQNLLQKPDMPANQEETPINPYDHDDVVDSDESDSESDSESLSVLLEPYSKDHLIDLICDAALEDSALFHRVRDLADRDASHRKIFVYGLGWDTTSENLVSAFEPFGQIEECNVVLDRATGKNKGYGFVLFKTRRAAVKALKNPLKKIKNRIASCQLASVGSAAGGPAPAQAQVQAQDWSPAPFRKIYVSNVPNDVDPERLRAFFAKFGEIETGPIGFDTQTGKSRGFALFVYKTPEGFRKALQEPYKTFEGHQLHCQKAADGKNKNQAQSAVAQRQPQPQPQPQPPPQPQAQAQAQGQAQLQPPPMMATAAAMAAAQNLAMFGQHPGLYPLYGGFLPLPHPAAGMIPGSVGPAIVAGTLNPGVIPTSQVAQAGAGVRGSGSSGGGSTSVLGSYRPSVPPTTLQALQQVFPNPQFGQAASGKVQGTGGAITGYPSYMCSIFLLKTDDFVKLNSFVEEFLVI